LSPLRIGDLLTARRSIEIDFPAGSQEERLSDQGGKAVGALLREWQSLQGTVEVSVDGPPPPTPPPIFGGGANQDPNLPLLPQLGEEGRGDEGQSRCAYRVTVRINNTTSWRESDREEPGRQEALRQTFASTHTILRVRDGMFVSLLEPPEEYQTAA